MAELTEENIIRAKTQESTMFFTRYHFKHRFNRKFIVNWHHEVISEHLDKVYKGEIRRLAIRIAPRYGKTELAVKNFISKGLAINPASKFIHLSYSADLALDNSEEVREFIQEPEYQRLYPYVQIDKASTAKKKWYTTAGGGVYATATGGQITGFGAGEVDELEDEEFKSEVDELEDASRNKFAGAIVIDDPLKPDDADSEVKRERVNERFENTIRSRTNSRNTPIIIIGQAVHERDLIGYLMEKEPEEWTLLTLPAIYFDDEGNECALWPHKHTLKELKKIRKASERTFESQYQQDPQDLLGKLLPKKSLMFGSVQGEKIAEMAFADPAHQGGDKLSCIFVSVYAYGSSLRAHVHDVIHNTDGVEANTPRICERMEEYGTEEIFIESNGLGLALVLSVKKDKPENTKLKPLASTDNKIVRILAGYESVAKYFVFNEDYSENREYNSYMSDLTGFTREGTNEHKKDAMDVTCGAANIMKIRYRSILFPKSK